MQRLGGLYQHRPAGGIPDAQDNHQRHQQPRHEYGHCKTSAPEGHTLYVYQFSHTDVEGNEHGRHGGQRQQQQSFCDEPTEHAAARAAKRHAQGYLRTAVLRAEPEGADDPQEDVKQQETDDT